MKKVDSCKKDGPIIHYGLKISFFFSNLKISKISYNSRFLLIPHQPIINYVLLWKIDRVDGTSIAKGYLVFDCNATLPYICHRSCNNYEFAVAIDNF